MHTQLFSLVRAWRAVTLLVVVVCLSPGRAAAQCGDYVKILNDVNLNNSPLHDAPLARQHTTGRANESQPAPQKPHHCPKCSNSPSRDVPSAPPAPPSTTVSVKVSPRHAAAEDFADKLTSAFERDFTSMRPIRRASKVFHPPRLV
jgi:hypothetical protein